jgi:hypothetical protein
MKRTPASQKLSRIRQRIRRTQEKQRALLQDLLSETGPLLRGTFVHQRRRCGKPTCRCNQGDLHPITYLSIGHEGRTRNLYVPAEERDRVEQLAQRYRRFRKRRAELAQLARQTLKWVDTLQQLLLQSYPSSQRPTRGRRKRGNP